ncbi:MAG: hypothetical protein ACRD3J_10865 [Thermoanaerobaculia bacterium]
MAIWERSSRGDARARPLADRHYNRQKIGAPQFVPPGRCLVLLTPGADALWVTSYPYAEYVQHAWAGAMMNSLFRNENPEHCASDLIRAAVEETCKEWTPPPMGLVSFVDPQHVRPTRRRGQDIYGYCYLKAGFRHVGYTKKGLWAWQWLPPYMLEPLEWPKLPVVN